MRYKMLQRIKELKPDELVSEYLINCCMYYELAVQALENEEFDYMAKRLAEEWEKAFHPHRNLIDLERLKKNSSGAYIQAYPSMTRSCACHRAAKIPGGPMHNKSQMFINSYVCGMMQKTPTWQIKANA